MGDGARRRKRTNARPTISVGPLAGDKKVTKTGGQPTGERFFVDQKSTTTGDEPKKLLLRPRMPAGQDLQMSAVGVWKSLLSKPIFGFLIAISLIFGFGVAYFGYSGNRNIWFDSLVVTSAPFSLGFLYVAAVTLLAEVVERLDKRRGRCREVLDVPSFLFPFILSAVFIGTWHLIRVRYEEGYNMSGIGLMIGILFVACAFEMILRFINAVLVPRLNDHLSEDDWVYTKAAPSLARSSIETEAPPAELAMIHIGSHVLLRSDILMLEAQGNYVNVMTTGRSILVRGPLSTLLEEHPSLEGMQVHRSRWVAVHACRMLEKKGADLFIHLSNNEVVKVVKARHADVREYFSGAQQS